jgi:hypothetical protein
MEFEDQMFRQTGFISPDDPANPGVDKAKFLTGRIDGLDARKLEVPFKAGATVNEGSNKTT